jgi:hypothetical protein
MGREVERLAIVANGATLERLEPGLADVLAAGRCHDHRLTARDELEDGVFRIEDATFAAREA